MILLWNNTTQKYVLNDDGTLCEPDNMTDAVEALMRVNDLKQLNPNHKHDRIVIIQTPMSDQPKPTTDEWTVFGTSVKRLGDDDSLFHCSTRTDADVAIRTHNAALDAEHAKTLKWTEESADLSRQLAAEREKWKTAEDLTRDSGRLHGQLAAERAAFDEVKEQRDEWQREALKLRQQLAAEREKVANLNSLIDFIERIDTAIEAARVEKGKSSEYSPQEQAAYDFGFKLGKSTCAEQLAAERERRRTPRNGRRNDAKNPNPQANGQKIFWMNLVSDCLRVITLAQLVADAHNAALDAEREHGQQECDRLDAFWQNQLAAERQRCESFKNLCLGVESTTSRRAGEACSRTIRKQGCKSVHGLSTCQYGRF